MSYRFVETIAKDWKELFDLADCLKGYVYRGQADRAWDLSTLLERAFQRYDPSICCYDNREHWMLHDFKRQHHIYSNQGIDERDNFEWLALMQHHGCPTRLLDFTESFYVALHFACATSVTHSAIYSINRAALRDSLRQKAKFDYEVGKVLRDRINLIHIDLVNRTIANEPPENALCHLVPVESKRHSERISRQKGIFLCPTNLGTISKPLTFLDNLAASFDITTQEVTQLEQISVEALVKRERNNWLTNEFGLIKISIPKSMHRNILEHLGMMGVSEDILFPGLDGLARSIAQTWIRQ